MLNERDNGILIDDHKFRYVLDSFGISTVVHFWVEINFIERLTLDDNLDVLRFYDIFVFSCKLLLAWVKLDINS